MATDLSALLDSGVILPFEQASSRDEALSTLSRALAKALSLAPEDVDAAVKARENLGSTGVGDGVAIPHARLQGIETPVGALMKLDQGVDFKAIDARPCDLIFMLVAPIDDGASHLRALAQVSRALRQSETRAALRSAENETQIRNIVCKPESALSD